MAVFTSPRRPFVLVAIVAGIVAGSGLRDGVLATSDSTTPESTTPDSGGAMPSGEHSMAPEDAATAMLATAGFQDVAMAEAAGYASSIDTLGCFQNPDLGGMGLHYINESLLDATPEIAAPEALVYELDATGEIVGLVAHEYIVPLDAWQESTPPSLFGVEFHEHPTLPLWVLHTWLWKENPTGVFQDWNPAVRQCPDGVPVFGVDLPAPATTVAATDAPGTTTS